MLIGLSFERRVRSFTHVRVVAKDLDRLVIGQCPGDLGVDPRNGPQLARPVRLVVRPGDPGGLVRSPFGGEGGAGGHAGVLVS